MAQINNIPIYTLAVKARTIRHIGNKIALTESGNIWAIIVWVFTELSSIIFLVGLYPEGKYMTAR